VNQADDTDEKRARTLRALADSGIFDATWYAATFVEVAHAGLDPAEHFVDIGWKQGRAPNFYFEPGWYLAQYPDVRAAGVDPLTHYLMYGDFEGRAPGPHFDASWYRAAHGLDARERALTDVAQVVLSLNEFIYAD
jgi:hypothetical protein